MADRALAACARRRLRDGDDRDGGSTATGRATPVRRRTIWSPWLLAAVLLGCGGDSTTGLGPTTPTDRDTDTGSAVVEDTGPAADVGQPAGPPTVSIKSPETLGCVGVAIELQVEAKQDHGIALVEAKIGEDVVATTTKATDGLYALSVDASALDEGPISISVTVTAKDGQKGEAVGSWMLDRTPPDVVLDRPVGQEVILGDLLVRGEATDTGCGVVSARATLSGGDEDIVLDKVYDESSAFQGVSMTLIDIDVGTFEGELTVDVTDGAGNVASTTRQVFVVTPLRFLEAKSWNTEAKAIPTQLVAGDWNRDGLDDAILAGSGETLIMRSVGEGRLWAAEPLIPSKMTTVTLVDLDDDGDLDLIGALTSAPPSVEVWIHQDDDTVVRQQVILMPDALKGTHVSTADLTDDGVLDLVVLTDSDKKSVVVFRGNEPEVWEAGTDGEKEYFQPSSKSFGGVANPRAPQAADFDSDGNMDIAVGSKGDSKIAVFLGDGEGGFVAAYDTVVDADPIAVGTGYFSGGGWPDLIVASEKSGQLYVLAGKGNGYFDTQRIEVAGGKPNTIVTGHFDDDAKLDFAVALGGANAMAVFEGADPYVLFGGYVVGPDPSSLVTGHFDEDENLDLVTLNSKAKQVTVMLGNGDGTFRAAPNIPMPLDCYGTVCKVLKPTVFHMCEADGLPGLDALVPRVVGAPEPGTPPLVEMSVFQSNGVIPGAWPAVFLFEAAYGVSEDKTAGYPKGGLADLRSGDLNGDGLTDIVVKYSGKKIPDNLPEDVVPSDLDVLLKKPEPGPAYENPVGIYVHLLAEDIEVGDMDGDGRDDVVALTPYYVVKGKPFSARVDVFRSTTGGALELLSSGEVDPAALTDPGATDLQLADVDVDGNLDVVVLNSKISDVAVLYGKKGILTDGRLVAVVSQNPKVAAVVHVNGDEDVFPDVLSVGKDMRVAFGKKHVIGEQPFETPFSYSNYPGSDPTGISGGDFNGDGLFDVVIADKKTNAVYLYAGIGDRQFARDPTVLYSAPDPRWLYVVDVDGDTCMDLVTAGDFGITILRNLRCE